MLRAKFKEWCVQNYKLLTQRFTLKNKYVLRDDKKNCVWVIQNELNCHIKLTIVTVLADVNTDICVCV